MVMFCFVHLHQMVSGGYGVCLGGMCIGFDEEPMDAGASVDPARTF